MTAIETVNQSLYFSATAASQEFAKKTQKKEKLPGKTSFSGILKKSQEEADLISEGLPPEIAGMEDEEALVFLKDEVDIAGDALKSNQGLAALEQYRKKISQLMKFITRNNFAVIEHKRHGFTRKGRPVDPYIQIKVINDKINNLTTDMIYNHADNLRLLAGIEEINGLIIDLLAA
jgi:uncharacterized protein